MGISNITIVNKLSHKNLKDAAGIYVSYNYGEYGKIELAFDTMFKCSKIFFYFPYLSSLILVDILYQEIGHHLQKKKFIKKNKKEEFCINYSKKMIKKKFNHRFILFFPYFIIVFLIFKTNK